MSIRLPLQMTCALRTEKAACCFLKPYSPAHAHGYTVWHFLLLWVTEAWKRWPCGLTNMFKFPWPSKKKSQEEPASMPGNEKQVESAPAATAAPESAQDFYASNVLPAIAESRRLASQLEDAATPFKHLYAAADVLLACQRQAEVCTVSIN